MNPYDEAHALARALTACDEFKAYLAAWERIAADPTKREMISDFRKQQAEIEMARLYGQEVDQSKVEQLRKLLEILRLNSSTSEFLEAETRMIRLLSDVQKIISDAIKPLLEPLGEPGQ